MKKSFMTLATFLVAENLKMEDFHAKSVEDKEKIISDINENNAEYVKELESNSVSKEELTKAIAQKDAEQKAQSDAILKNLGILAGRIAKMGKTESGQPATVKSIIAEKFEEVKGLQEVSPGSSQEVTIKADVSTASVSGNTGGYVLPGIGQLNTRAMVMENLFPTITVSGANINKNIKYYDWDEATVVRAAEKVAECALFPESTAAWIERDCPIIKIGDTIPVCEEFFEDESMFAGELEFFLRTNVALKVDSELINGPGGVGEMKGLIASSTTYVPVASGISDASIYDLIVVLKKAISEIGGSKYMPNFVLMNNADICKMKLKKDSNNNYILPPFVDRSGNIVDGLMVMEDNAIPANQLVLGDSNFGRIYSAAGLSVSRGTVDKQFIEDAITLKVRRRLALVIREADKAGFMHVPSISAALVTLAS
jgi:hypothetical protein